ncbi:MAG: class I SAM-dependent methyltransferase [Tannerella sp.]|nr:class I SAM-dependent methyltransferase [Tannerella sp.]
MDSKEIPDLQGVQRTLMLPLWGRAVFSKLYPEVPDDRKAIDIIDSPDYDFREIEKAFGEYGGLSYVVRGRKIDNTVKHFISEHPNATVVNIGAGPDTTFSRVDNGAIHRYDIDINEVVAIRKMIASWSPLLHLKSVEPFFKNIKRDKRRKRTTRMNMTLCDLLKMVSFYHLKFES